MFEPKGEEKLSDVRNIDDQRIGLERMIVAYSRTPNLGNLLSYRNLEKIRGRPVSSFWITHRAAAQQQQQQLTMTSNFCVDKQRL